jgi:acyl carrier protein
MDDTTLRPAIGRRQVLDCISELLPGVLRREIPPITADTRLMAELGMRSASVLELLLGIEDTLDIQIEVEDIDEESTRTVGDLADFVAGHSEPAG